MGRESENEKERVARVREWEGERERRDGERGRAGRERVGTVREQEGGEREE